MTTSFFLVLIMLDMLSINIPFNKEYLTYSEDGQYCYLDMKNDDCDVMLGCKSVYRNDEGNLEVGALYHPYESLPTNFTGMAMKIYHESNGIYEPYLALKASPAKLLQGHNVFGSDDIETAFIEMMGYLCETYPKLYKKLDILNTVVSCIDVTYSARANSQHEAEKVIEYLRHVSNGKTMLDNRRIQPNTVYWGGSTSRLINIKCYLKHNEFMSQFAELSKRAEKNDKSAMRSLDVMKNSDLVNWTVGLIRLEARLKMRWLKRKGIPTNIFGLIVYQRENPDCLRHFWESATSSLLQALRGHIVKFYDDDEVLNVIENSAVVRTALGKFRKRKLETYFLFTV